MRSIAYFGGNQTGYPLLILGGYAVIGILLSLLLCALKPPQRDVASGTPVPVRAE